MEVLAQKNLRLHFYFHKQSSFMKSSSGIFETFFKYIHYLVLARKIIRDQKIKWLQLCYFSLKMGYQSDNKLK